MTEIADEIRAAAPVLSDFVALEHLLMEDLPEAAPAPATEVPPPELHRFGKRILMHCGTIQPEGAPGQKSATQVWRDVTERVNFANSKYEPHQGVRERARRLRQAQRGLT